MGIPGFYHWMTNRYKRTVRKVKEETPVYVNGVKVPIDTSRRNPNGIEFDNLYVDMNGIIHPCFHPEGLPDPDTYDQVFKAMFNYIDRLFSVIRPRKLLYLAIDGVAPRAKMNQQRARRFTAAKDAADEANKIQKRRKVYESEGGNLDIKKLDSNVITPGTEFMALLSLALRYYVHLRMNADPGWRKIKVILSDANVPGEGEHMIMSYIRLQRNLPVYDPNTRHCLYGLDADLIMLALTTHEINFSILREAPAYKKRKQGRGGTKRKKRGEVWGEYIEDFISSQTFEFLNIWVLRDYLEHDLRIPDPTVEADFERLLDDFVFMCLLVGNDFLPHLASLLISEGAIDLLLIVYKNEFVRMGGYITNSSEVNFKRMEHFVQAVSSHENAIIRKCRQGKESRNDHLQGSSANVKLGEEDWKKRYYNQKFEVNTDHDRERVRRLAVLKYTEGISWIMHYYYQGVCSWQWFYPYHYGPFASDFYGLDQLEINFTLGSPFKPFDQLMGVFPAASAQALPLFYRKLMTDPFSPILDFYPTDFEIDKNGRKHAWQAICKLPFIEECRLLSEIAKVEHTLTDEEKQRNSLGLDILFVHTSHPLAAKILSFSRRKKDHQKLSMAKVKRKIDPKFSGGMNGYMYISDKPVCPKDVCSPVDDMETITENEVISVFYKYPSFHPHIPRLPEGVKMPPKSVGKHHVPRPPVLWHEKPLCDKNLPTDSRRTRPPPPKRPPPPIWKHKRLPPLGLQHERLLPPVLSHQNLPPPGSPPQNLPPPGSPPQNLPPVNKDINDDGVSNEGKPRKKKRVRSRGKSVNKEADKEAEANLPLVLCNQKSVSEPSLAEPAHQLVDEHHLSNGQDTGDDGVNIKGKSKKRKRGKRRVEPVIKEAEPLDRLPEIELNVKILVA